MAIEFIEVIDWQRELGGPDWFNKFREKRKEFRPVSHLIGDISPELWAAFLEFSESMNVSDRHNANVLAWLNYKLGQKERFTMPRESMYQIWLRVNGLVMRLSVTDCEEICGPRHNICLAVIDYGGTDDEWIGIVKEFINASRCEHPEMVGMEECFAEEWANWCL